MAMHLEFVVLGPPISNQQSTPRGKANLTSWRAAIARIAKPLWSHPCLTGQLKAVIINFYSGGQPSVDVDNMSKPILDELQSIVYDDDRQIVQAEISHLHIESPLTVVGISKILLTAINDGIQFVYIRIEDPIIPFRLPK